MEYQKLGRSDLEVSRLGLGTWPFGGDSYGLIKDGESADIIRHAVESGINFIDTSNIYGRGHSEEVIGRAISKLDKDVYIATKGGWTWSSKSAKKDFSLNNLISCVEGSLRRLKRECIDLYQLHNPSIEEIERGELFDSMERLIQQGKIRYYGISIHEISEAMLALKIAKPLTIQVAYNMMDHRASEELFDLALEKQVGIIAREPLSCGMLTEKYRDDVVFKGRDHRKRWSPEKIRTDQLKKEQLKHILDWKEGMLPQIALEFVLKHPAVTTVIPGARTLAQFKQNLAAMEGKRISQKQYEAVKNLYKEDSLFQQGYFKN